MSEKLYFCAITERGFIKAITISPTLTPAEDFIAKNDRYALAFLSAANIREKYIALGLKFEVERTQKNPFAGG